MAVNSKSVNLTGGIFFTALCRCHVMVIIPERSMVFTRIDINRRSMEMSTSGMSRRSLLQNLTIAAAGAVVAPALAADEPSVTDTALKGRIKQSASKWVT